MKKIKVLLSSLILMVTFVPAMAGALNLGTDLANDAAKKAGFKEATETTFSETLGTVVKMALSFVGVIFMSLMVYAGYLWMTAKGKEDQVEKAQDIIRAAIIGLIITLAAYSITNFIVPRLLEKTTT